MHFSASLVLALACAFGSIGAAAAPATDHEIVVVGDSVSAEYGLARGTGWVALLGQRLAAEKLPWTVANASISGDTTSGGLARLPTVLKQQHPSVVIIELGGNDALRGLPMSDTRKNLDGMAALAAASGARVLIARCMSTSPPPATPRWCRSSSRASSTSPMPTTGSRPIVFTPSPRRIRSSSTTSGLS
jgi:acyl-CoA thioesterase-1